jgi:hypothetical protein
MQIALGPRDLDLLERGLGELLYKPGGDPDLCPVIHELQTRLRRAAAQGAATVGAAG